MKGFLKPKNIIVWFGVLIKVHINSDPLLGPKFKLGKKKKSTHKKTNNDGLSFLLNDHNILGVIMRVKCEQCKTMVTKQV